MAKPRHNVDLDGYGYLVLLAALLAYLSATIGSQLTTNVQTGLLVHIFRLYAQPVLLALLLIGLVTFSSARLTAKMFLPVSLLIGAGLIYAVLDVAQYGMSFGAYRAVKDIFYNKVTSSYFVAVLVFAILAAVGRRYGRERTSYALVVLPTAFALCSLVFWAVARFGIHSFSQLEITNNNTQAYESSAILLLLFFAASHLFSPVASAAIVLVHGLVPLLHQSRGGMVVELVALVAFLVFRVRRDGLRGVTSGALEKTTLAVAILLAAGLGGVFGHPARDAAAPNEVSMTRRLADLMHSPTLSRHFQSNSEVSSSDDTVSAYSRIGTTLLAVRAFTRAPIKGIGIWNAYSDIQVADFGIHGLWPLLMAAYGSLGLIPVALVLAMLWGGKSVDRPAIVAVVVIVLLVGLVFNRYPWWLGGLLWAFSNKSDG